MKFLLVAGAPESLVNFRFDLIQALQNSGYEVHVVSPDMYPTSDIRGILESHGVIVHSISMSRTGLNPLKDLNTLFELISIMKRLKPDAFLGYTIKPVIWGSFAAYIAKVPSRFSLITGLGYAFVESSERTAKRKIIRYLVERLYKLSLSCCSKVFFQNPDDQNLFHALRILDKRSESVVVKGSGVNLAHYHRAELPANQSFIMISRLLVDKGVRQYAEAAETLKMRYPEVKFKLVGYLDDNPESVSQGELDSWIESGAIEYLGKLKDVRGALSEASAFVLPSYYREGVPRTILEALSIGRAIITTDTPGCRETVVHGKNGYLVKPKSVGDLVSAMENLIQDPALQKKMSDYSYFLAEEYFDVHKVNRHMLKEMGIE